MSRDVHHGADPRWVVLSQSHSPAFQAMMGRLAERFGHCLIHTGMPHPTTCPHLTIEAAAAYDRRSLFRRAASWAEFGAGGSLRAARLTGKPFLFATTNPPFLPHVLWLLRKTRGLRYGLLVWDIYPEHIARRGWLRPDHPALRYWMRLNALAMRDAEVVITIGEGMAGILRAQLATIDAARPIEVIPNWADVGTLRPVPKAENAFATERALEKKTVVLYSGNMGATHGLDAAVAAADALRGLTDLRFLFIGDGLGRLALENEVRRRALDNVHIEPLQPWSTVPLSLATADVAIIAQEPGTENLSLPSKTYSSLAVGSALLALTSDDSDLANLTRELGVGLVCRRDDPVGIANAVRRFHDDSEFLAGCKARARRAAVERFSEEAVFAKFAAALGPSIETPRP